MQEQTRIEESQGQSFALLARTNIKRHAKVKKKDVRLT